MAGHNIIEKYRIVFGSQTGREVLADILASMGYFQLEDVSPEGLVLHNQAKIILQKCGLLNYQQRVDLLEAWFSLPFEVIEEA